MTEHSIHELNRRVVARYWEEFWTKGNVEIIDELCYDDYTIFYPLHGLVEGKAAVRKMKTDLKKVFPDISFKLLFPFPLIAEGDYVVARWLGGGKHTGEAFHDFPVGALLQPNSGKEIRFSGTTIFRLKNGRIIEETGEEASLLALQQLGLIETKKR